MRKFVHIAMTAIIGCGELHAAAAQTAHDPASAARAAFSSATAGFESSGAEASGIVNGPSSTATYHFSAVESGVLAGAPAAEASSTQRRSSADLETLISGLLASAADVPSQASAAMIAGDLPASVAVAFAPNILGRVTAASASAATEVIGPTQGAGSVGDLLQSRPSRKR